MRKKLVFLGSKPIGYHCLEILISQREALDIEVLGILTQQRKEFSTDNDLAAMATAAGIPVLQDLSEVPPCDILYSVQYHQILKQPVIDKAGQLAVNLHMAPLPEYRGCNQFTMAILDGKAEFGTTLHRIDARIDHGDILFQKRFPVPPDCWVTDLYDLTYDASLALFRETLPDLISGHYTPVPQEELVACYGTALHYRNEIAGLKQIDLAWDGEKIGRHIRATSMPGFEPPYTLVAGQKVYFIRTPA